VNDPLYSISNGTYKVNPRNVTDSNNRKELLVGQRDSVCLYDENGAFRWATTTANARLEKPNMKVRYRFLWFATLILVVSPLIAFAQKPELLLQTGHIGITSIAFNPDGKLLATSNGRQIKIWQLASGLELRTLMLPDDGDILSLAFAGGSNTLAEVHSHHIRFWNIENGSVLRTISAPPQFDLAAITSDGRLLIGNTHGVTKLWDLNTGSPLRTLTDANMVEIALSGDGKTVATLASRPNVMGLFDKNTITIWSGETGAEIRTFKEDTDVKTIALSQDGRILASGTVDQTVRLWNLSTGAALRTIKRSSGCLAFNHDGSILAIGNEGRGLVGATKAGTIALIDLASKNDLREFKAQTETVLSIAFSSDGRMLASGTNGDDVKLWNLTSGDALRTLRGHYNPVNSVVFSDDNKALASGSSDIRLWDLNSGRTVQRIKTSDLVSVLALSPDGSLLAVKGGDGNVIDLYDAKTGNRVRSFEGHSGIINSIQFSPDSGSLVSASVDDTIRFWDPVTGTQQRLLKANSKGVRSIGFSPNGKMLASGGGSSSIEVWDVYTGARVRTLGAHTEDVDSVAFSSDNKMLASRGDGIVELWNVNTGMPLRSFRGDVVEFAFSADGKILATADPDGTVKVWEISTGNVLASLIAVGEKGWLVVTPDGLFDGSAVTWNKILWRFSRNLYDIAPVEIFFNEFYYPDLLADLFAGKRPRAVSDIAKINRHQPQLRFALPPGQASWTGITARDLTLKIAVTDAASGARDVRLFRNGLLVKAWHGDVLRGQSQAVLEATIPIVAGENRLTAYAFNHDNIKSSDATLTITGADSLKRKGVGYILAVGVNEYANSQYNLKYAVADAQDFAEELQRQQTRLNNYERVDVISLNDKEATKSNILKSLSDLSAKVQPEDALVIFFAGHGTAQQNRFYLIPHDLGYAGSRTALDGAGLQNILSHSISDEEISRAVEGIDAGQMLLVIDACNSGQALEAEEKRRGPMNSKGLAQLAYEKGMYILTAAQSYQAANEAERYGHGFLTYALVEEGLKTNAADREPKDGQVMLREWLDFATERVPQMQQDKLDEEKKEGRQLDRIKFAEADSGNERSIQRPRVFYRRETETHPLVVARP
jgi:WD40 repeat protein